MSTAAPRGAVGDEEIPGARGSQEDHMTTSTRDHDVTVGDSTSTRYPYQAVCTCGWKSRPMAATYAAQFMAETHIEEQGAS